MGKYTRLFIDETRQYLEVITLSIPDGDLADSCRLAHSIKGMALFEEQPAVVDLAYALEQGLGSAAKNGARPVLCRRLTDGVTLLRRLIDEVDRDGAASSDPAAVVESIERELAS